MEKDVILKYKLWINYFLNIGIQFLKEKINIIISILLITCKKKLYWYLNNFKTKLNKI